MQYLLLEEQVAKQFACVFQEPQIHSGLAHICFENHRYMVAVHICFKNYRYRVVVYISARQWSGVSLQQGQDCGFLLVQLMAGPASCK